MNNNIITLERKKKILTINYSFEEFYNFDIFKDKFNINYRGVRHSCISQINYTSLNSEISEWRTLGEQIKFIVGNDNDYIANIESLHIILVARIEELMTHYNLENEDINEIRLILFMLEYNDCLVKRKGFDEKSLGSRKDLINISKTKKDFNHTIPLTVDLKELGKPLSKEVANKELGHIALKDGSKFNLIDKLKTVGTYNDNFNYDTANYYEYDINNRSNIVAVDTKDNNREVYVYNKLGMQTHHITDNIDSTEEFSRTIGKVTSYINKKGIYRKEINQAFKPVTHKRLSPQMSKLIYSDYRIGTMDLETFVSKDNANYTKTYALGFYTKNNLNIFYIDKSIDSDKLIKECLDNMLKEKYSGYTFYVHNLGKYDITFILKVLISMCKKSPDVYSYDSIWRNGKVLGLTISRRTDYNKVFTIKLVDSLNILNGKLSDLCKTFEVPVVKGIFPYKFVNENTLFYIGDKPDYNYYEMDEVNIDDYNKIPSKKWSTKDKTKEYLKNDLISLYLIFDKFIKFIWRDYGVHVNSCLTISGISMEVFLRKYYSNNIPLIKNRSVYNDIRSSYYGGITEVYIPYGENLYYYDVNSLYPFAVYDQPMPGVNCKFIDNINKNMKDCGDIFGFYYCRIKTTDDYIGLIPVRSDDNSVMMPLGKIEGWYFSEELKFAQENGYDIEILHGYEFEREYDTFKDYITEFYNIKKNSKDNVMRSIAKSLLNNLLGRFGLELDKPVTQIVDASEFADILQYRKIKGNFHFIENKVLFTSVPFVNKEICDSHEVDYKIANANIKSLNAIEVSAKDNLNDVSVAISSAVTSYARIHMNKIKLDILNNGGKIYYTDTDSIVTDIELKSDMVGKDLGQLKLEHVINKAYFLSNKAYCLVLGNDTKVEFENSLIKIKGYNRKDLVVEDFENMYKGIELKKERFISTRNYSRGFTVIKQPRTIHFSITSYKKREKLLKDGLWVDTKPLYINNFTNRGMSTYAKKQDNNFYIKWLFTYTFTAVLIGIFYIVSTIMNDADELTSDLDIPDNEIIDDIESIELPVPEERTHYLDKFFNLFREDRSFNSKFIKEKYKAPIEDNTNENVVVHELYKDYIDRLEKQIEEKDSVLYTYMVKDIQGKIHDRKLYEDISDILKEYKNVKNELAFTKSAESSKYNTPITSINSTPITKFISKF